MKNSIINPKNPKNKCSPYCGKLVKEILNLNQKVGIVYSVRENTPTFIMKWKVPEYQFDPYLKTYHLKKKIKNRVQNEETRPIFEKTKQAKTRNSQ